MTAWAIESEFQDSAWRLIAPERNHVAQDQTQAPGVAVEEHAERLIEASSADGRQRPRTVWSWMEKRALARVLDEEWC